MKTIRIALISTALAALAASSFAAPAAAPASPKDFANGPAQWLMTRADKAEWRNVKTDAEAQRLIDLFWARRDPTPGTTRNEFHEEFNRRVADADASYATARSRGSLTDKGRVHILLGPPANFASQAGKIQDTSYGTDEGNRISSHELAAKDTFSYGNGRLLGLIGDVVFIQDLRTKEWHYDPQQGNVAGALGQAVSRALVNPGLKEVPEWATAKAIEESHTVAKMEIRNIEPTAAPTSAGAKAAPAPIAVQPAGARPLVLLKDINTLNPRGAGDPFTAVSSLGSFTKADDLGYATTLCVANYDPANAPSIKVGMTITGESGGEKVRMTAPEEDYTPDAMRMLPGCYLVRGALPLADFGAGAYKLSLTLTDPSSQQKYNLEQTFKVE